MPLEQPHPQGCSALAGRHPPHYPASFGSLGKCLTHHLRRELLGPRLSPKLRALATEDYSKRGANLYGPGFVDGVPDQHSQVCSHPRQKIAYLGFIVDSNSMALALPQEKLQKVVEECTRTLTLERVSVRALLRLIGLMSAATQAILSALQKPTMPKEHGLQQDALVEAQLTLNQAAKQDLLWWIQEVEEERSRWIILTPCWSRMHPYWDGVPGCRRQQLLASGHLQRGHTSTFWR